MISHLLAIPQPILLRTASGIAAEVVAEEGGTGKIVLIGQFGQRGIRLQQVEAYLHDGVGVDGLLG